MCRYASQTSVTATIAAAIIAAAEDDRAHSMTAEPLAVEQQDCVPNRTIAGNEIGRPSVERWYIPPGRRADSQIVVAAEPEEDWRGRVAVPLSSSGPY